MKDHDFISFEELSELKSSIRAVYFPLKCFNLESIIRWLYDRGLYCGEFSEKDGYYIFLQNKEQHFQSTQIRKLSDEEIKIEIGE